MPKVTIFGAGNVGATCAHVLAQRDIADICLIDIVEGMPQGKALDMRQAGVLQDFGVAIEGSNDYAACAGSDVVVITAGLARKPGMDRMDLLRKNAGIVAGIARAVGEFAPNTVIVMVTNPLDVMTFTAKEASGFPRERVVGMAGVLDSARLRAFIAMELGVSVVDVSAMVLGGHGDSMVPLPRYSTVNGISISEMLDADRVEALGNRTRKGGGEIVALLKTGSAFYAPATSAAQMAEAIIKDRHHLLPCSCWLEGEYGLDGVYCGVPAVLGAGGLQRIVELGLHDSERAALHASADNVRSGQDMVREVLAS
jgi:malate dehydrogenase